MPGNEQIVEVTPELLRAARIGFRAKLNSESSRLLRSAVDSGLSSVEIDYGGERTEIQLTAGIKSMIDADKAVESALDQLRGDKT